MNAPIVVYWLLVGSLALLGLCSLLMFASFAFMGPKEQRSYDWWSLGLTVFAWIVPALNFWEQWRP